jgi:eukaryotic-like serine/threonine-protein kinase
VKVSDFGVARLDTSDLTSTGFMVGTPNYMSPEGLQGHAVDARSDLYSVGVLFYELLTRQRPVREVSLEDTLNKLNDANYLSGRNIRSIKPILRRALQPTPTTRFQSAAEFIDSLKAIDDMDLSQATTTLFPAPKDYKPETATPVESASTSQWSDDLLVSLEHSLAKYVGPVAKLLIRKQSKTAASVEALVSSLTQHIPNENERSQFMKAMERTGITTAGVSAAKPASPAAAQTQVAKETLSATAQEKITQMLAFHIGPLAGRVMQKAMKTTLEPNALLLQLAKQIPDEKERKKFLEQASRLI